MLRSDLVSSKNKINLKNSLFFSQNNGILGEFGNLQLKMFEITKSCTDSNLGPRNPPVVHPYLRNHFLLTYNKICKKKQNQNFMRANPQRNCIYSNLVQISIIPTKEREIQAENSSIQDGQDEYEIYSSLRSQNNLQWFSSFQLRLEQMEYPIPSENVYFFGKQEWGRNITLNNYQQKYMKPNQIHEKAKQNSGQTEQKEFPTTFPHLRMHESSTQLLMPTILFESSDREEEKYIFVEQHEKEPKNNNIVKKLIRLFVENFDPQTSILEEADELTRSKIQAMVKYQKKIYKCTKKGDKNINYSFKILHTFFDCEEKQICEERARKSYYFRKIFNSMLSSTIEKQILHSPFIGQENMKTYLLGCKTMKIRSRHRLLTGRLQFY